jgi:uncharacterized protein (DUF58 family)
MVRSRRDELFDDEFLGRLQRLHLMAKRLSARGAAGARRGRKIGDGLEFADHRSYAPGDDVRFIDWPYYARMEKLLLRLFHQHSEADVDILLDTSASMAPGQAPRERGAALRSGGAVPPRSRGGITTKFDYALRTAAAIAFVAMGGLERVILQPFADDAGQAFHTGRNRGQILEVLDYLAGLTAGGPTRLARSAARLARTLDAPATVLLISDMLDCGEELSDVLAELCGRGCDVTVLHVYSPLDADPDLSGPIRLEHAESKQAMVLHVTDAVRESYRLRWAEFQAGLSHVAASRGAVYVAAPADMPFEQLVLRTLRRVGVLEG